MPVIIKKCSGGVVAFGARGAESTTPPPSKEWENKGGNK